MTPLPKFLYAINNSICRITGVKPSSVNLKNWPELWKKLYADNFKNEFKEPKFKEGDAVRITLPKQIFDKGYFPSRSDHIYEVAHRHKLDPEFYELEDSSGKLVKGRFYRPEMVKTRKNANTTYRVEKVIRSRKTKEGEREYLVTFIGYPKEYYWIHEKNFVI